MTQPTPNPVAVDTAAQIVDHLPVKVRNIVYLVAAAVPVVYGVVDQFVHVPAVVPIAVGFVAAVVAKLHTPKAGA